MSGSDSFDPYEAWLNIPPVEQPPNFYRLLGLPKYEDSEATIDAAAKERTAYLHPMAAGPNRDAVQRLLSEVAKARRTLLSAGSKAEYDAKLRAQTAQAPAIQIETVSDHPSRGRASRSRAGTKAKSKLRTSKVGWIHDWRLHAASILTLLFGAILLVIYMNRIPDRVAAEPMAPARDSSSNDAGKPPRRRSAGRSLLAPDQQDPTSQQTDASSPRKQNAKLPRIATPDLRDDWLDGLAVIMAPSESPEDVFEVRQGEDQFQFADGMIVIGTKPKGAKGGLIACKGVILGAGDSVAMETNLRKRLPDAMRVGFAIGPIRLFLESKRNGLQLRCNNQNLGLISNKNEAKVQLLLTRGSLDPNRFDWIVRAGAKAIAGRVSASQSLGDQLPVSVALSGSRKALPKPVWIAQVRSGRFEKQPTVRETTIVRIRAQTPQ